MTNSEKANDRALAGKCLCGAVQYAVADEFVYALNCHCSNCRRATGSAFRPFAGIERSKLRITKGEDNLMIFGDERGCDTRRNVCGGFLYSVACGATAHYGIESWEGSIGIPVGAFAEPAFPAPTFSVYQQRKHAWVGIPPRTSSTWRNYRPHWCGSW